MRIQREITETLVYGSHSTHRYTQDSPVLADVWIRYGEEPLEWQDLLLTPQWGFDAGHVSLRLREHVETTITTPGEFDWRRTGTNCPAHVAYNQVYVAARLYFDELIRLVLPMTGWWTELWRQTVAVLPESATFDPEETTADELLGALEDDLLLALELLSFVGAQHEAPPEETSAHRQALTKLPADLPWFVRVVGVLAQAVDVSANSAVGETEIGCDDGAESAARREAKARADDWIMSLDQPVYQPRAQIRSQGPPLDPNPFAPEALLRAASELLRGVQIGSLTPLDLTVHDPTEPDDKLGHVHLVNLNRRCTTAVHKSRLTIKADAAERLFAIDTGAITWGIIDSGIDARHPAFCTTESELNGFESAPDTWAERTRVKKTYDFTRIRMLLDPVRLANEAVNDPLIGPVAEARQDVFEDLRTALIRGRSIDWALLEPFLRIPHNDHYYAPEDGHGTHVAGILGANWPQEGIVGICKEINLYDLRVIAPGKPNDEFAVLAALQFVQWLNAQKDFFAVHGVNLSLSIRHEVANFACGRTPVCDQCEDLIGAGVTVVAAAGNAGYLKYKTASGPADLMEDTTEGYHTVSITDPGNASRVITVGSTHREKPHDYGVSYFSSRGPTGDGRQKPDIVAPGEKVVSTFPNNGSRPLDGTSMAAPHVSGAAAMLMARHTELVGQPERIKEVLVSTATDLGRERYFQGAGVLDVLRALQSV